jgi:hypothetical protein
MTALWNGLSDKHKHGSRPTALSHSVLGRPSMHAQSWEILPPFIYLYYFSLWRSDKEQNKTTQFAFNHRVLSAYEESQARNSQ